MSEVGDLSFIIDDGVLSEAWVIQRAIGGFQLGGWTTTTTLIPGWGVVSVASDQDLLMIPEGDRVSGAMVFHSSSVIYETEYDPASMTQYASDIMLWNNQSYRILSVGPYPNRQYWKAIGVRMAGV
jgi:hypothetical protein